MQPVSSSTSFAVCNTASAEHVPVAVAAKHPTTTTSRTGLFANMNVRRHEHDSGMDMDMDMGGMDMGSSSVAGVPSLDYLMQYYWAVVGTFIGIATLANAANIFICRQRSVPALE